LTAIQPRAHPRARTAVAGHAGQGRPARPGGRNPPAPATRQRPQPPDPLRERGARLPPPRKPGRGPAGRAGLLPGGAGVVGGIWHWQIGKVLVALLSLVNTNSNQTLGG